MRHTSAIAMLAVVLLAVAVSVRVNAVALPQCHPSVLQNGPEKIRKVCAALFTLYELSNNINMEQAYLDEKGGLHLDDKGTLQMLRENAPLIDSGVKRQDVDHVFLRFGRRR